MHRSASNTRTSDEFLLGSGLASTTGGRAYLSPALRSTMEIEIDHLPGFDHQSNAGKEAHRFRIVQSSIHLIPVVLIFHAFVLWIFSDPQSNAGKKESHHFSIVQSNIHLIPVALIFCAFILWIFSSPCMGTVLDYNLNPISKFSKKSHDIVPLGFKTPNFGSTCKRLPNKRIKQFPESMDRYLKSHAETVRQTMMMHEEIFKQQVQELHRLYKVQKTLMAELKSKDLKQDSLRNVSSEDTRDTKTMMEATDSPCISTRYPSKDQLNQTSSFLQLCNTRVRPSSQKLSICSEDPLRIQKGYGLEQPAVNDDDVRVRQNAANLLLKHLKEEKIMEDPESRSDGESDIELTLSIGGHGDKKKSRKWLPIGSELGCNISKHNEARQLISTSPVRGEAINQGSSSESFSEERLQGPPWLLRSLNLNRT